MKQGIEKLHTSLEEAKVQHVFIQSPGTAHEWQTWRRNLQDFAPRLSTPDRRARPVRRSFSGGGSVSEGEAAPHCNHLAHSKPRVPHKTRTPTKPAASPRPL